MENEMHTKLKVSRLEPHTQVRFDSSSRDEYSCQRPPGTCIKDSSHITQTLSALRFAEVGAADSSLFHVFQRFNCRHSRSSIRTGKVCGRFRHHRIVRAFQNQGPFLYLQNNVLAGTPLETHVFENMLRTHP